LRKKKLNGKPEGKSHLGDLDADGRVILEGNLKKQNVLE
jgi:hypothetical protein